MGQTTISTTYLGTGVVGEFARNENQRSRQMFLNSDTESYNVPGSVVLMEDGEDDVCGVAQDGNFAGILISPKNAVRASLDEVEYFSNDALAEVAEQGYLFVELDGSANIGDYVYYSDTDGTLTALDPDTTMTTGYSRLPGGIVERYNLSAAGTAIIYFDKAGDRTETA